MAIESNGKNDWLVGAKWKETVVTHPTQQDAGSCVVCVGAL